jgi:hypothetical protein
VVRFLDDDEVQTLFMLSHACAALVQQFFETTSAIVDLSGIEDDLTVADVTLFFSLVLRHSRKLRSLAFPFIHDVDVGKRNGWLPDLAVKVCVCLLIRHCF